MDNIQEDNNSLQFLLEENAKLSVKIKILSKQIDVAFAGLDALIQNCNDYALNIAKATSEQMRSIESKGLPQEENDND